MADNTFGIALGGGAGGKVEGGAFGGIGVSNFTVLAAGVLLLAGLTAHVLNRKKVRQGQAEVLGARNRMLSWESVPHHQKRRMYMSHMGHADPMTYEDAANDLYGFTSSVTLPDTAMLNHDRIKACIHRQRDKIKMIMDSMADGEYSPEEAHHRIHALSQNVMDELELPHRDSVHNMPYTVTMD